MENFQSGVKIFLHPFIFFHLRSKTGLDPFYLENSSFFFLLTPGWHFAKENASDEETSRPVFPRARHLEVCEWKLPF